MSMFACSLREGVCCGLVVIAACVFVERVLELEMFLMVLKSLDVLVVWSSEEANVCHLSSFLAWILLVISRFSACILAVVSCVCGVGDLCFRSLRCFMRRFISVVKLGL